VGNNFEFAQKFLMKLAGQIPGPFLSNSPQSSIRKKGRILFDSIGGAWVPNPYGDDLHSFPRRLEQHGYQIDYRRGQAIHYEKYELVIVVIPLQVPGEIKELIQKSKRVLLIGDGFFQELGHLCEHEIMERESCLQMEKEMLGFVDYEIHLDEPAINSIAREFGFRFAPKTLISNRPNPLESFGTWRNSKVMWSLRRSGVLLPEAARKDSFTILAQSSGKTKSVYSMVPIYSTGSVSPMGYLQRLNSEKLLPEIIAMKSKQVFALAEVEIIFKETLDSPAGAVFFTELMSWLEN